MYPGAVLRYHGLFLPGLARLPLRGDDPDGIHGMVITTSECPNRCAGIDVHEPDCILYLCALALLEAGNQSYAAELESYKYGVRSFLDVTAAQRTLAQARAVDVLARTQVLTAIANLAFQTADTIQSGAPRFQP